jgi:hypothetical protein
MVVPFVHERVGQPTPQLAGPEAVVPETAVTK